jgi:hypothetical protein
MKWAHGVMPSLFFHAEVGGSDAERLFSHNNELKDEFHSFVSWIITKLQLKKSLMRDDF